MSRTQSAFDAVFEELEPTEDSRLPVRSTTLLALDRAVGTELSELVSVSWAVTPADSLAPEAEVW